MGGVDKAFVILSDRPLIAHCIGRLAPQVGALAISAQGDPLRFAELGLPVLLDPPGPRQGPLAGLQSALAWAKARGASHLVSVPVDGPFLPLDLVASLGTAPVPRLAQARGRLHPTFGVWPTDLAKSLRNFLASGAPPRLRDFAAHAGAEWVDFPDARGFENLNTAQDVSRAEGRS